jgi:hypothetical protein
MTVCFLISSSKRNEHEFLMKLIDIFGPRREPIFPYSGLLRSLSDGLQYVISGCVVAASGLLFVPNPKKK